MRPLAVYIVFDAALARQPNSLDRITLGFVGQGARERDTKARSVEASSRKTVERGTFLVCAGVARRVVRTRALLLQDVLHGLLQDVLHKGREMRAAGGLGARRA